MPNDADQLKVAPETKRLCSEIQLFDLCDRERCGYKDGRYCTQPDLLTRFERIAEEDDINTVLVADEEDGDEYDDDLDFDNNRCDTDEEDGDW